MSTHESISHEEVVAPGSDRGFGLVVGGVLAGIGLYQLFTGTSYPLGFLVPGFALILVAVAAPGLLHPLNVVWTRLGLLLGRIVTPVVMGLVYLLTIVPIGAVLRLLGKDPLRLKRGDDEGSYWIERLPPGPSPESLEDQF